MAESMAGLKRTHRCTEVSESNIGQEVVVMGWVQKSRNKGGIIFVDLRDRSGLLQIIFEESDCGAESFAKAEKLRSEFVIAVTGMVEIQDQGRTALKIPFPGSAQTGYPEEYYDQKPGGDFNPAVSCRGRFFGD